MPGKKSINSVKFVFSLLCIIFAVAVVINADKFYKSEKPILVNSTFVQIGENEFGFVDIDMMAIDDSGNERGILQYIVQPGDTLGGIARMFGTTISHIQKVNNLRSGVPIKPRQKLIITDEEQGFLYTIEKKTNIAVFANTYNINLDDLLTLNYIQDETEILQPGQELFVNINLEDAYKVGLKERPVIKIIPKVTKVAYTPVISKPTATRRSSSSSSSSGRTSSKIIRRWAFKKSISNQFYAGHCTWYVATQVPEIFPYVSKTRQMRPFGGNANKWYDGARNAGIPVGQTPRIGSIIVYQRGSRWAYAGHVGIVIDYKPTEGTMIIRDMNWAGKFIVTERYESVKNSNIKGYVYRPSKPCKVENGKVICNY